MPRATSGFSVPSSGRSKSSERPSLRRRSTGESLSEAPLPHLVRPQRAEEVDLPEARPIHVDEVQFGVGELPQEEVRDPPLSARAEYEVRIRQVRRVEALREELLVDVVRADGARLRVADDVANRLKDLLPAAVCNGDVESVFLVSLRPVFRVFDRLDDLGRQETPVAEHMDPDLVFVYALIVADLPEVFGEEVHEVLDLRARTLQVLRRERVDGQDAHADLEAPFEDFLELVSALHVAVEDVAEADLPSEAPVAVHDDRDVMGDHGLLDLMHQAPFVRLVRRIADDFRDVRRHRRTRTIGGDLFRRSRVD